MAGAIACRRVPATEADRHALLTVRDLSPFGVSVPEVVVGESFKRVEFGGSSYQLEYQFHGQTTPRVVLVTNIDVEPDTAGAIGMGVMRGAMGAAMRVKGILVREDSNAARFGTESFFGKLVRARDSLVFGELVMIRRGAVTYTVVLNGFRLRSSKQWIALIAAKLAYLDSVGEASARTT